jgi:carbamoyltransferase
LLVDGQIKISIEEERLNRVKYCLYPAGHTAYVREIARCRAADYCLKESGITAEQVDMIITNDLINPVYYSKYAQKTITINHHFSHACSTYFTSPFDHAAILVADGCGSITIDHSGQRIGETMTFFYAESNHIEVINRITGVFSHEFFPEHSIGEFYNSLTQSIGFRFLEDGKTMGLAAYGKDVYVKQFQQFYDISQDGIFSRSTEQARLMDRFIRSIMDSATRESEKFQIKADLAFAGQHHLETIIIQACLALHRMTGCNNLCLSGGVFLNCVANSKVFEQTPFKNIYIFPAAGDAGLSVGSALYGHHIIGETPYVPGNVPFSPYLGKIYANEQYLEALNKYTGKLTYEKIHTDLLFDKVAQLLSNGKVIGWFQNRSEIGPRALGSRSILADARNAKMKDYINNEIKGRESFRPFSPIVLETRQEDYFHMPFSSHHMLFTFRVREDKQNEIPAAIHADGLARVQSVSEQSHPELFKLLCSFEKSTGVPALLNTSFNTNGSPIVESPLDAVDCFMQMNLDYLVLNNYLVTKTSKKRCKYISSSLSIARVRIPNCRNGLKIKDRSTNILKPMLCDNETANPKNREDPPLTNYCNPPGNKQMEVKP